MKCDNKDAVLETIDISLASGQSVDKVSCNWECSQVQNINKGNGGHCQVNRNGCLNMTVK